MVAVHYITECGLEHIGNGFPLPQHLRLGQREAFGIAFTEGTGILMQVRLPNLSAMERKVWAEGAWQFGVRPCGPHSCIVHAGFRISGMRELSCDFSYSGEVHRRGCGDDVLDRFDAGTLITYVVLDAEDRVYITRQTFLSERMAAAFEKEFTRQAKMAGKYSEATHQSDLMAAFQALPILSGSNCLAWEHSMKEA